MSIKNVKLGKGVRIPQKKLVNLYDCEIGENTLIGAFVEIQKGVRIGKNCKIESHSFICEGITIEDDVFIGHNVSFINDKYPRANNPDWKVSSTIVRNGVSIGTGSTIMCGITIGNLAMIGAGSVVINDIPECTVWVGCPAKKIR